MHDSNQDKLWWENVLPNPSPAHTTLKISTQSIKSCSWTNVLFFFCLTGKFQSFHKENPARNARRASEAELWRNIAAENRFSEGTWADRVIEGIVHLQKEVLFLIY